MAMFLVTILVGAWSPARMTQSSGLKVNSDCFLDVEIYTVAFI
jgi:hypothetical protein